jgi:hypothetical protein
MLAINALKSHVIQESEYERPFDLDIFNSSRN